MTLGNELDIYKRLSFQSPYGGLSPRIQQSDIPLWQGQPLTPQQRALEALQGVGAGIGTAFEQFQEYYTRPIQTLLTLPWHVTPETFPMFEPPEAMKPWMRRPPLSWAFTEVPEREATRRQVAGIPVVRTPTEAFQTLGPGGYLRERYEEAEMPRGLKTAAGIYAEAPLYMAMGTAAGAKAGLAGIAARGGRFAKPAAIGAKAMIPAAKAEAAIAYPMTKIGGVIAARRAARTARGLLPDLMPIDDAVKLGTQPTTLRRLADRRAFRWLANKIGGKAATAQTPAEKALLGRAMLRFEGGNKATVAFAQLEQLGSSKAIFGLDDLGLITSGPMKGTHINTIRTYPLKYMKHLTPEQKQWINQAGRIEKAIGSLLKRNGVEIRELRFEEGGRWAGRKVAAKFTPEGELADIAYIGAGPGRRIGTKLGLERPRVFPKIEDAIKEGYRYLPEEEAILLNTMGAYNRVADKQMADWVLKQIPYRTTGAPQKLIIAADNARRRMNVATRLNQALNRAIRGERLPEQTIASIEREFPGINLRAVLGNTKALRALRPQAKQILQATKSDFHWAEGARARAREMAMRPRLGEAIIPAPAFSGKIFKGPEARQTARTIMGELDPQFSKALEAINQLNAVGRYFVLAGDISPATIQLIFLAGSHPKQYAGAMKGFVRSMFNKNFHAKYLAKPENTAILQKHVGLITTKRGTEFTEAMGRSGLLRRGPLKIMGRALTPFQRGFETSLDVAGIEMAKGYNYMCTTPQKTAMVDSFINNFRGLFSTSRIGIPAYQRQVERAVVLAPQYNRAIAALFTDVFRRNLTGKLARENLAKGISAIVATAIAVSYALGEDEDEIIEHLNPASFKFMTWNIAGQSVGPGSKVRSVLRLWGRMVADPESAIEVSEWNPEFRWLRGNWSPMLRTGYDLWTGRDYIGDPTRDGMLRATKTVLAENLLPIWTQSVFLEGEGPLREPPVSLALRGGAEFMGARGYPQYIPKLKPIKARPSGLGQAYPPLSEAYR